ncbi:MAG: NAD(P)-dependent oxidoreductase [Alphaproteobacteria bacterium]
MKKLYVCHCDLPEKYLNLLKKTFDVTQRTTEDMPKEDELCDLVKKYDALLITIWCPMTKKVLDSIGGKEFVVATTSVGLDHFDKGFFSAENITVYNCHDANYLSVAEHTIAVILALYKKLPLSNKLMFEHKNRDGLGGLPHDLTGQTIGLIGSGKIARKVIDYAKVFEMKILCYSIAPEKDLENVVEFCSMEKLLKESDIVSLHAPLTPQTKNMLNKENMSLMKSSAFVINTARLPMIDNVALAELLQEKKIAGASLDIDGFEFEVIDLFKEMDNVILTPHTAGVTVEAWDRMICEVVEPLAKHHEK